MKKVFDATALTDDALDAGMQNLTALLNEVAAAPRAAVARQKTDGDDVITGTSLNDTLRGGLGNDTISGWGGNDFVGGGEGRDQLYGNKGTDIVSGNKGRDFIGGGPGDDFLSGGRGFDFLTGGSGADVFYFKDGDGWRDRVTDFENGTDAIAIETEAGVGFSDLKFADASAGDGTEGLVIRYGTGSIFLEDYSLGQVTLGAISENDFIFV